MIGIKRATVVPFFIDAQREDVARIYPISIDPLSPINIEAGLKLKYKKPSNAPPRADDIRHIITLFEAKPKTKFVTQTKNARPAARPSIPSTRFIALIIPTIHNRVTTGAKMPISITPINGRETL